jgi:hypothetical protein
MKSFVPAILAVFILFTGSVFAQTSVTAPATSAESPEIQELQKVEDSWSSALNQRDQYGLELVLSPLFVNVSATGDITTRNQQVVSLITQEDKTAVTDMRVITVRMLGDVAVANGTYSFTHKGTSGMVEEKGVFTHVFQRQHGNWLCLNAQRTLLREDTPGKAGKAKAKSESKAELPFHIPLFSKSDKSDKSNQ